VIQAPARPQLGSDAPRRLLDEFRAVVFPWATGLVLTLTAYAIAKLAADQLAAGREPVFLRNGFFAWDADWYRGIAEHGYHTVGEEGLRFWPLFPLAGRGLSFVFAGNTGAALLVIANLAALVFLVLLRRLVRFETGSDAIASRAVWLAAIWPTAFVLFMGYAESLFLALAVACFLALRRQRWWWAATFGFLAGLTRPFAVFLVLAAAVEAWRSWRGADAPGRLARVGAALAPGVGILAYLAWVQVAFHDAFLPLTLQSDPTRQGSVRDPFSSFFDAGSDFFSGDRFVPGLHFLWAAVLVGLLVVIARRLPASYTAFAGATLVLALAATNLDSLERYAMGAFPFVVATAMLVTGRVAERPVTAIAAGGLVAYGFLAFIGVYVP